MPYYTDGKRKPEKHRAWPVPPPPTPDIRWVQSLPSNVPPVLADPLSIVVARSQ